MKAIFPEQEFQPFKGLVYTPAEDSYLLLEAFREDLEFVSHTLKPENCLEIGVGSGIVITSVAKAIQERNHNHNTKFFGTDINEHAIRAATKCLELNGVTGVELFHTSMADAIKKELHNKVDLLISNPPFEPSPEEEVGHKSVKCAWAAGSTGRAIIDMIIPELPDLMSEKGVVYMIVVADNNVQDIVQQMKKVGFLHHKVLKEKLGTTSSSFDRVYQQYVIRFSRGTN